VSSWLLGVIRIVRPSIDSPCLWVAVESEYLDIAVPNRLTVEYLFDGHSFEMG